MPLTPNQRLGAYEIVCSLGSGGMGEVYRARDTRLGRDVAIKVLPPDVTTEPGRLERFDREARAIAALNHPHIVTIYSTEEAGGIRFLTMELIDGCTLSDLIISTGMAIPKFLDIAIPLADALGAAHQKQITHRDLKPGNVMLSNDGRVKVLDFGLARVGGGTIGEETMATRAPITHQGMIVGTMPYMSPEQVEGRVLDARSDLFSLGVIFYELLSGERPFKGSSSPALMSAILRDTPPAIGERRSDIPEPLQRLVDRLLEKRPEDRWQTSRDVFNELRHIKKLTEPASRTSSTTRAAAQQNLSIAVLPFTARNSDADSEDLASGLTDDVAAGLAKFPLLSVVAAQATRAYRDSPLDVRQIAERVGARYVIGGQIRKSSRVIRVTAQLIDAGSGAQLWSETYDRDATAMDLFAIQDDLTDHIVATIGDQNGVLARSMVRSIRVDLPASDQTTRELILRTWGLLQSPDPQEHATVRSAIEARLADEPQNADLWAELSHLYLDEHILAVNELPDSLGRAMVAARRAVEIDPGHQRGWNELAATSFFVKDRPGLFEGAERAVQLNPRNSHSLAWMGNLFTHAGDYERGSAMSERAMAINPRHAGWMHFAVFNRHFASGNFDEALRSARRVNMPQLNWNYYSIAAAAAHLGLEEEARQAAVKMTLITPKLVDPSVLRDFTERWYWQPEMVKSLLAGVGHALSIAPSNESSTPPSNRGTKPPSSSSSPVGPSSSGTTVAVLPFVPRSSDDETKSLADGLTDDITRGLSRFGYLRVLPRSLAERLAREGASPGQQARFVLEGSVRRDGPTIRVNLTLVETDGSRSLWTEAFDRDASTGTFTIQDDLASTVAATIGDQTGVLVKAMGESLARVPVDQLSVSELVIRYHLYTESFKPAEHLILREAFERALEKEPRHAEGWACLARLIQHERGFGFNPLPDILERQRRAADRAVEIDPRSQFAWIAMASVHEFAHDREALTAAVDRAISLNPLNADMVARGALFLSRCNQHERAETLLRRAIALKPQHPGWYYFARSNTALALADYEGALAQLKRVNTPAMPMANYSTAAAAGHLGRAHEAKAALAALAGIDQKLIDLEQVRAYWAAWLWDDEFVDRMVDGVRKAKALAVRSDDRSGASSADALRSREQAIAVLPFTDLSEKKDQDWFCDGIAEEIMSALTGLPGLRVAARASAFSFRGRADDLEAIAERLNVGTVLEGSVRRAGDRVRITTQLSDARQGKVIWSERFDRELKDIFDVQEEIARAVADRLRVSISGGAERLVQRRTANFKAYELLLKGRELLMKRGPAIANALTYFEQAIALDPDLSAAHAGLGDTYRLMGLYGLMPVIEILPKAKASLERALALDPDDVEALATVANIATGFEWDFARARTFSERALAIDPTHVRAIAERAITTATSMALPPSPHLRQFVLEELSRARTLDPLNPWTMAVESLGLSVMGEHDAAIEAARRAREKDSGNFTAHWALVTALAGAERDDEAVRAIDDTFAVFKRHPWILAELAGIEWRHGNLAAADTIFTELQARSAATYIGEGVRAVAAASAGRRDEAQQLLAAAIEVRDAYIAFYKFPAWRAARTDAGCMALLNDAAFVKNGLR